MKKLVAILLIACAHVAPVQLDSRILDVKIARELPREDASEPYVATYKTHFEGSPNFAKRLVPKMVLASGQAIFGPGAASSSPTFNPCITVTSLASATLCGNVDGNFVYWTGAPLRINASAAGYGIYMDQGEISTPGQFLRLRHVSPGILAEAATGKFQITSNISAANANGTTAPMLEIIPQNALDGTDLVLAVRSSAGTDLLTVAHGGAITIGGLNASSGTFAAAANSGGVLIKDTTNNQTFTQIVNNATWDLYNNSNQKLFEANTSGAMSTCVGTPAASSTLASLGGNISVITADVTSSGNASNLTSYTLPANALTTTNRCLRIVGTGTSLNNANAKTVSLAFGGQTVISKQLAVSIASETWKLTAIVCRSGSNTQDIFAEGWNEGGTTVSGTDGPTVQFAAVRTAGTQTETSSIVIKGVATTATTTDITMDMLSVEYL